MGKITFVKALRDVTTWGATNGACSLYDGKEVVDAVAKSIEALWSRAYQAGYATGRRVAGQSLEPAK